MAVVSDGSLLAALRAILNYIIDLFQCTTLFNRSVNLFCNM